MLSTSPTASIRAAPLRLCALRKKLFQHGTVARVGFQAQQPLLQNLQMFFALGLEKRAQFQIVNHGFNF
jgi:hypothetical protein